MGKKIVVITSSFRKDGNSTALAEAFIEEAQKKGHSVKRFDAAYLNIGPCHGCDTCFKTGKACTFDDDFNTVAPYIEEADAVILATPTYWFSIPGKVKCLIDKLYSFCVGKKEAIAGKKAGLLCTCRSQSTSDMEGIIMPYHKAIDYLGWENIGEILISSMDKPGELQQTAGDGAFLMLSFEVIVLIRSDCAKKGM